MLFVTSDKMLQESYQDSSGEEIGAQRNTHSNLPFFSFKTIITATRNFNQENKLGQGGFGSVYKVSEFYIKLLMQEVKTSFTSLCSVQLHYINVCGNSGISEIRISGLLG
jgi:hypothetical protein